MPNCSASLCRKNSAATCDRHTRLPHAGQAASPESENKSRTWTPHTGHFVGQPSGVREEMIGIAANRLSGELRAAEAS